MRELDPRESQMQVQLISELKVRCKPGVIYFHIPNGEYRDARIGAKLKAMGTLPGVADLQFIWLDASKQVRVLFLELKRRSAALSPEQWAFSLAIRDAGALYDWANSVEGALDILRKLGLLKR